MRRRHAETRIALLNNAKVHSPTQWPWNEVCRGRNAHKASEGRNGCGLAPRKRHNTNSCHARIGRPCTKESKNLFDNDGLGQPLLFCFLDLFELFEGDLCQVNLQVRFCSLGNLQSSPLGSAAKNSPSSDFKLSTAWSMRPKNVPKTSLCYLNSQNVKKKPSAAQNKLNHNKTTNEQQNKNRCRQTKVPIDKVFGVAPEPS